MKFFISLCISYLRFSIIYYINISLIKYFHLHTIFLQSLFPRLNFRPINLIFTSNLILYYIQNCLIKFRRCYSFLTTKTSFTFSRRRRISCHISIITDIRYTIIIWLLIPYCSFIVYIIKIFSINSFKIIPKSLTISLFHPYRSLYTILTIRGV